MSFGGNWRGIAEQSRHGRELLLQRQHQPLLAVQRSERSLYARPQFSRSEAALKTPTRSPMTLWWEQCRRPPSNTTIRSPAQPAASIFPDGAFINRHFKANEFEYYVQDSWRIKPTLTVTYRRPPLDPPGAVRNQGPAGFAHRRHARVVPERGAAAARRATSLKRRLVCAQRQGQRQPGLLGQAEGQHCSRALPSSTRPTPAPRIRAGAGMYFDHFGQGIVNSFDQEGSFGLTNASSPRPRITPFRTRRASPVRKPFRAFRLPELRRPPSPIPSSRFRVNDRSRTC